MFNMKKNRNVQLHCFSNKCNFKNNATAKMMTFMCSFKTFTTFVKKVKFSFMNSLYFLHSH